MKESSDNSDGSSPSGQTVYEVWNITFLDIGVAQDYADQAGFDLLDLVHTRYVRYGISKRPHFTRASGAT